MTTRQFCALETAVLALCAVALVALPWFAGESVLMPFTVFAILGVLALSISFVWGVAGLFSFGQSVFFGVGAYVYAVVTVNYGDSTYGLIAAMAAAAVFAVVAGYFMLYGRISDIYLAVITLTLSLLIFQYVNTLSGESAQFGAANIGGANGMPGVAPINLPGAPDGALDVTQMYLLSAVILVLVYVGLRLLLRTGFGETVVAIRENETRAELLGYDSRGYKLAVFTIGAVVAGLAGALYAAWGNFIAPDVFGLGFAGQIIIWAMVGGVASPVGPIVGCFIMQALTTWLGTAGFVNTSVVLGVVLIVFVLLVPSGLVPTLRRVLVRAYVRD
jgi:branched-chain amino acid transport system permease protein